MRCTVEITETAEAELDEAYRRLRDEYSADYALRWREALLAATETLERFPERCPMAPESQFLGRKIRQFLHGKRRGMYRILFEVQGKTVCVLHIRHAARQHIGEPPPEDGE